MEAKQKKTELKRASQQAEIAKFRFEKREQRLAAKEKSAARRSAIPTENKLSSNNKPDVSTTADSKKALIEAAIQRKKNKRHLKNHNGDQDGRT